MSFVVVICKISLLWQCGGRLFFFCYYNILKRTIENYFFHALFRITIEHTQEVSQIFVESIIYLSVGLKFIMEI